MFYVFYGSVGTVGLSRFFILLSLHFFFFFFFCYRCKCIRICFMFFVSGSWLGWACF